MEKTPRTTAMRVPAAPNPQRASELLRVIANRPSAAGARSVDKPLAIYGAGNLGKMAATYFRHLGVEFLFVVDANPSLHQGDPFWEGVTVFSANEIPIDQRESTLLAVCVATSPFSDISASLLEDGWRDAVPFYDIAEAYQDRHPLGNGWFVGQLDRVDLKEMDGVMARWKDDVSRAHHLQFVAWHRLREDWHFNDAPVTTNDRYFIPELLATLHDHESFLDVGAHHGEVIQQFVTTVGNRFAAICAIEPDTVNQARLSDQVEPFETSDSAVNVLTCAVGEKQGRMNFYNGLGYASQFADIGPRLIEVKRIDDLGLAPTFIKLHLEGWELSALKGSLNTLTRYRPIVVTTAYHNRLGLWELPKWLMDNLSNYAYLVRLHSWCGTGLVIYCIPDERVGQAWLPRPDASIPRK